MSQELIGRAWIGFMWLSVGTGAGCCDSGNEAAAFIKCREPVD